MKSLIFKVAGTVASLWMVMVLLALATECRNPARMDNACVVESYLVLQSSTFICHNEVHWGRIP